MASLWKIPFGNFYFKSVVQAGLGGWPDSQSKE